MNKIIKKEDSRVDGFLLVNKARGLTSMDVVRKVKRLTGMERRVGHGGTLDPLAEGVLPICFGQATRLMDLLINEPKEYQMDVLLGESTDTYDAEGAIIDQQDPSAVSRKQIEEELQKFQGLFWQEPPMHSALKQGGKRLYELARQGLEVEREPRQVRIYEIKMLDLKMPIVTIAAVCGRGMYMRSLANDLGTALKCGGHTSSLIRRRIGPFQLENTINLEEFAIAVSEGRWRELIRPPDSLLLNLRSATLSVTAEREIRNGQSVPLANHGSKAGHLEKHRLYSIDGRFIGIGRLDRSRNQWDPHKILMLKAPSPHAPDMGLEA